MWKFFFILPIYPICKKKVFMILILRPFMETYPGICITKCKYRLIFSIAKKNPALFLRSGILDCAASFILLCRVKE